MKENRDGEALPVIFVANDNAWQRQLNWNAVRAAKAALKVFEERNGDTA